MFKPHPIKRFESRLIDFTDCTNDVREFIFSYPEDSTFTPGQFVTLFFSDQNQKHRRQYSIKSSPQLKGQVHIIAKHVKNGPGSNYLWNLQKNDTVDMMAPLGVFVVRDEHKTKPLVFLSTGTGVAPFVSIIQTLLEDGFEKPIHLITGYRHTILCHNELLSFAEKYSNFTYIPTLTKPQDESYDGARGRIQKHIELEIPSKYDAHFYVCGLYKMIVETGKLLSVKNIARNQIHFERYD